MTTKKHKSLSGQKVIVTFGIYAGMVGEIARDMGHTFVIVFQGGSWDVFSDDEFILADR